MSKLRKVKKGGTSRNYILTSTRTNLLNPALHSTCFGHLPSSLGIKLLTYLLTSPLHGAESFLSS